MQAGAESLLMPREYTELEREQNTFIGIRIERARRKAKISQRRLAEMIGLSGFKQMYRYECGQSMITAGRLLSIANALNLPVSYFLEGLPNAITR